MTHKMIDNRIAKIEALEVQKKAIEKQIAALKTAVQDEMGDAEQLQTEKYIIHWAKTIRQVFDTASFKRSCPLSYEAYLKASEARRFSYSAIG